MSELMTARIVRPEQSDDCMHTVIRWFAENELLESFSMASAFRSFTLLQYTFNFEPSHFLVHLSQNEPANQSTQAKNHRFLVFPNQSTANQRHVNQRTTNETFPTQGVGRAPTSGVGVSCTSFAWKLDRRGFRLWLPVGSLGGWKPPWDSGGFAAVWGWLVRLPFFFGPRVEDNIRGMYLLFFSCIYYSYMTYILYKGGFGRWSLLSNCVCCDDFSPFFRIKRLWQRQEIYIKAILRKAGGRWMVGICLRFKFEYVGFVKHQSRCFQEKWCR